MTVLNKKSVPVAEDQRRKLTKKYNNLDEMYADGWTKEELESLIQAPRTKAAFNGNMPKVDGFAICGTSLMTEEEAKNYYAWKKGKSAGAAPKQTAEETAELWKSIMSKCEDEELKALLRKVMPRPRNPAMDRLFGTDIIEELEKCSVYWIMFRGPKGERHENRMVDMKDLLPLVAEGWMPALGMDQIRNDVAQLKSKGINVENVIVGL